MIGPVTLLAEPQDDFTRLLALEIAALGARCEIAATLEECAASACLVVDLDRTPVVSAELSPRRIGYTRGDRRADFPVLHRPFRMAALRALLTEEEEGEARLVPSADFHTVVTQGGDTVHLSEREAALFGYLYRAAGAPVPREVLAAAVFPEAAAPADAVTVYIHYLRKKLERNGRRVITARRGSYSLLCD